MSLWGVVASAPIWAVVGNNWDKDAFPLGWVSFSAEEAHAFVASGGITHLLVEARGDLLQESLVDAADSSQITLVALVTGPAGEEVASTQGVSARVRQPDDLRHLGGAPADAWVAREESGSPQGLSIAVWGPTGAPGRTTVATSLASLIAGRGLRVLLIDADARSGAIAPALGLLDEVPGFIASCRLADRDQLTASDLRRLVHRYDAESASCDVLSGVTSGRQYPEVTPDTISQVVDMAKTIWEVVIIDTGSDISAEGRERAGGEQVATTCLRISDEAFALCQATPVGVARFARVYEDAKALRGGRPFPVVLNAVDTSRRSLSDEATLREALRRFASVTTVHILARDGSASRQAEMAGVAIVDCAPGSPFVAGLKTLAARWVDDALARRRRHGTPASEVTSRRPKRRQGKNRQRRGRWRILSKRVFALR